MTHASPSPQRRFVQTAESVSRAIGCMLCLHGLLAVFLPWLPAFDRRPYSVYNGSLQSTAPIAKLGQPFSCGNLTKEVWPPSVHEAVTTSRATRCGTNLQRCSRHGRRRGFLAVRIRLRRTGGKGQPSYRIVVADSRSPRDGRFIETIGHYNPRTDPATYEIDEQRARYWLSVGAQPSDPVARLLEKKGLIAERKLRYNVASAKEKAPAQPAAEEG